MGAGEASIINLTGMQITPNNDLKQAQQISTATLDLITDWDADHT